MFASKDRGYTSEAPFRCSTLGTGSLAEKACQCKTL